MMEVIKFKNVSEKYRIKFAIGGKEIWEDLWALKDISFNVKKGETLAIIGENGAGKTTVLRLIAGMLTPDKGEVYVQGKVAALLELGAGFHPEFTGRENLYLNTSLFGLTKEDINSKFNEIVEFSGIGRFIDAQIKSYSQGMFVRLAFSIAVHINPDILLVDDTLAVGDEDFQRKCVKKIFELKETGKAIIFVTHDMNMARRLCERGILLKDGTIIKDSSIGIICNYYTETVGSKKGVGILQKGPLTVIFNNGRLILRWEDKTITCDLSGHSIILSSGREYLSTTADWQVQKLTEGQGIIAVGKWPDISISQHWKIVLLNEKEFFWEIIIQAYEKFSFERCETRVFFIDEYKSWFTLDSQNNFSETFIHEKEWECKTFDGSKNLVIGLEGDNGKVSTLPTIIFDKSHHGVKAICDIGNIGFEIHGRVLQYRVFPENLTANYIIGKYRFFSGKIKFFEPTEKERIGTYLNQVKQIIQESKIIHKDSLSILCKEQQIEIYWQDKLLTRNIGLNTRFEYGGKNYSAMLGRWSIYRKNEEEVTITIAWDGLSFKQILSLKLQGNNTIFWEIILETHEEIKIRNKETELLLSEEYKEWITKDESGDFSKLDKKGSVILNKYINKLIGVEGVYKIEELILPGIFFCCEDAIFRTSYISKSKEDASYTTKLQYTEIDLKQNFSIPPGRYEYFKGIIKVVSDHRENNLTDSIEKELAINQRHEKVFNKIEFDRMSLLFDYGRIKIFWDGSELTKCLGLYVSIFFKDNWHDSSQAFWQVQRLDGDKLAAIGYWPWISLIQMWEINILNEKTFLWKIINEIWDDVILEKGQVNLMASERYKKWFVHKQSHGKFPEIFSEHNGIFWDRMWCGKALSVGIKRCKAESSIFSRQFLPSVVFSCSKDCRARYSAIENTDNLFEARLLQYELGSNEKITYREDKNRYFEGKIEIIT